MRTLIVIPARFGSVRIPGKPLRLLHGKPLLLVTVQRVLSFGLDAEVVVATDDSRLARIASEAGVRVFETSAKHGCGTERVAEVVERAEFVDAEVILNVQCDHPSLPREAAIGALQCIDDGYQIGTAAAQLAERDEANRNRVKVVVGHDGCARQFSREMPDQRGLHGISGIFLHLGVYAYTRKALLNWVSLSAPTAEIEQGLEQLRPFLRGTRIGVALLRKHVEPGIDALEDLANTSASTIDLTGICP